MKKLLKTLIIILVILIIGIVINYINYPSKIKNIAIDSENSNILEKEQIIKITDGKIENEDLIDKFIEECYEAEDKITLKIENDGENVQIDFIPASTNQETSVENSLYEETTAIAIPKNNSELEFGFFVLTKNGENEELFNKLSWEIRRKVENNQVVLYFEYSPYGNKDISEIPEICRYDLKESNYIFAKKPIQFYQRRDMKAIKIIDKSKSEDYDFDIYTVGGDVNVVTEEEASMDFKDALEQKIITVQNILDQAKIDTKYGICQEEMYSDGGTITYRYEDYTLIKYNTLDGNTDFVIGPEGDIRNQVDKILSDTLNF